MSNNQDNITKFEFLLTLENNIVCQRYFNVRNHAQHAVSNFFLKAIHDRQDNDQGCHAKANAQHGNARNEGNEPISARGTACAGIAPT